MKVLVSVATLHGATGQTAEAIGDVLRSGGPDVAVMAPDDVREIERWAVEISAALHGRPAGA